MRGRTGAVGNLAETPAPDFRDGVTWSSDCARDGVERAVRHWSRSRTGPHPKRSDFAAPANTRPHKAGPLARGLDPEHGTRRGIGTRTPSSPTARSSAARSGADRCRPGETYFTSPCRVGARGYGADAISRYDVATTRAASRSPLHRRPIARAVTRTAAASHWPTSASRPRSSRSATTPCRPWTSPARCSIRAGVAADADVIWSAADNTGIRNVRVLLDGQERSRLDLPCDYTFPRPCSDAPVRASRPRDRRRSWTASDSCRSSPRTSAETRTTVTRNVDVDAHRADRHPDPRQRQDDHDLGERRRLRSRRRRLEVRNRRDEPFRALPTTLANGQLPRSSTAGAPRESGSASSRRTASATSRRAR